MIIKEWINEASIWCDYVWDNELDIIEEFNMAHPGGIKEALPLTIYIQTIYDNRESNNDKIKEINN